MLKAIQPSDPVSLRIVATVARQGRYSRTKTIIDRADRGVISEASQKGFQRTVTELIGMGAEAVILGCTEIGLLLQPVDVPVPLFDTTALHAEAAGLFALDSRTGA